MFFATTNVPHYTVLEAPIKFCTRALSPSLRPCVLVVVVAVCIAFVFLMLSS